MALGDPYCTEEELTAYLKITVEGNETELGLACTAASEWIDGYCRRQFNLASAATARTFDASKSGDVYIDDLGSVTNLAIATDSGGDGSYATAWSATDYQLGPANALVLGEPYTLIRAVGSLTFPPSARRTGMVKVTAIWGWPAVPDAVKQAALIQAARLYKRRESAEGVLGFGEFGPVRVGARIDPDVEALLAPYKLAVRFT